MPESVENSQVVCITVRCLEEAEKCIREVDQEPPEGHLIRRWDLPLCELEQQDNNKKTQYGVDGEVKIPGVVLLEYDRQEKT